MLKSKAEIDKYFEDFLNEKRKLVESAQYIKVPRYKNSTCGLIAAQIGRMENGKHLSTIKFMDAEIENTDELREHTKSKAQDLINDIMKL